MTLKGKVAIVTGGNTGIGKAVVLALAEAGANIVIDYIADEQAELDLEQKVRALGDQVVGVKADVSKVDDLKTLVATAVSSFGRLDVMVNNAGIETRTSVLDTTEAQYAKVLDINLKSAFFGTQLAAKQMISQGGGGRIINMTSVHEDWPMPGNTAYCLSKGGMRMLTRTAGVELAPHNILVVGVGPGAVDTPINKATVADPKALATLDNAIPLGRLAEPEEIGSIVAFLAGDGATLSDRHHHLRRRRPHAEQSRTLTARRSEVLAVGQHLLGDEGEMIEVVEVEHLEVGAGRPHPGEGGQFGYHLVGGAAQPVLAQLVDLAADGSGSPGDFVVVPPATDHLGDREDHRARITIRRPRRPRATRSNCSPDSSSGRKRAIELGPVAGGQPRRAGGPASTDDDRRPGHLHRLGQGRAVLDLVVATGEAEPFADRRRPQPGDDGQLLV